MKPHYLIELLDVVSANARKDIVEDILNEIYIILWEDRKNIADTFINLDLKIREIALREHVYLREYNL